MTIAWTYFSGQSVDPYIMTLKRCNSHSLHMWCSAVLLWCENNYVRWWIWRTQASGHRYNASNLYPCFIVRVRCAKYSLLYSNKLLVYSSAKMCDSARM